jgi:hypothetical protein
LKLLGHSSHASSAARPKLSVSEGNKVCVTQNFINLVTVPKKITLSKILVPDTNTLLFFFWTISYHHQFSRISFEYYRNFYYIWNSFYFSEVTNVRNDFLSLVAINERLQAVRII